MEKANKFLIHFWLAVAIASTIFAVYMTAAHGWEVGQKYFFVPVISFVWYLFRRMMYKRMSAQNQDRK
jgi:Flp pilus assembly protein TadB